MTLCLLGTGCASHHKHWGSETSILPGWHAVGQAAKNAISDPQTWVPLIGAGAILTLNADEKITEWAVEKDLMFVSNRAANDASDDWLDVSQALVYATALATPSGEEPEEWLLNKSKGLAATYFISQSAFTISSNAKKPFDRERPDKSNNESFPSSHALRSSMWTAMAARNVDAIGLNNSSKLLLKGSLYTLSGMTAWARIEANKHHPSDVLVGYSVGRFFGIFLNDAFITPANKNRMRIRAYANEEAWRLGVEGRFD